MPVDHRILQSPTTTHSSIVEDLPALEVEKPRYGGDGVALMLEAEMHKLEGEVQDFRDKAENADRWAMTWDNAPRQLAEQRWIMAQNQARWYRAQMEGPEREIAIRRDILAQFKAEDDLSETGMQPE
jgi:hypothetical protein